MDAAKVPKVRQQHLVGATGLLKGIREDAQARGISPAAFITGFKAQYFAWFNAAGLVIQLFVVSRIMTRFGVRNALPGAACLR